MQRPRPANKESAREIEAPRQQRDGGEGVRGGRGCQQTRETCGASGNEKMSDIYPSCGLHNSFSPMPNEKQLRLNEFQISGLYYANKSDIEMCLAIS